MGLDKYMSVEEASKLWGFSMGYVRRLCRNKRIKCIMFQDVWVIEKDQPNPKKYKE